MPTYKKSTPNATYRNMLSSNLGQYNPNNSSTRGAEPLTEKEKKQYETLEYIEEYLDNDDKNELNYLKKRVQRNKSRKKSPNATYRNMLSSNLGKYNPKNSSTRGANPLTKKEKKQYLDDEDEFFTMDEDDIKTFLYGPKKDRKSPNASYKNMLSSNLGKYNRKDSYTRGMNPLTNKEKKQYETMKYIKEYLNNDDKRELKYLNQRVERKKSRKKSPNATYRNMLSSNLGQYNPNNSSTRGMNAKSPIYKPSKIKKLLM